MKNNVNNLSSNDNIDNKVLDCAVKWVIFAGLLFPLYSRYVNNGMKIQLFAKY